MKFQLKLSLGGKQFVWHILIKGIIHILPNPLKIRRKLVLLVFPLSAFNDIFMINIKFSFHKTILFPVYYCISTRTFVAKFWQPKQYFTFSFLFPIQRNRNISELGVFLALDFNGKRLKLLLFLYYKERTVNGFVVDMNQLFDLLMTTNINNAA